MVECRVTDSTREGSHVVAEGALNMSHALALTGSVGSEEMIDQDWDIHEFLMKMFLEVRGLRGAPLPQTSHA